MPMPLITWEPFNELDRFIENFPMRQKIGWDLAVDVYEQNGSVIAEMNLPGIDPEKIDISVEDSHLHISGSREETTVDEGKQYHSKEIRRGAFERVVRLPEMVDKDAVTATYENGTLVVTMPKQPSAAAGKVKVHVKKR